MRGKSSLHAPSIIAAAFITAVAFAQSPEVATREVQALPSFSSQSNLVIVPVVVRDKKGVPVGTLNKEDFELYDKGKLQVIAKFSVEKAGDPVEFEIPQPAKEPSETNQPGKTDPDPSRVAERYIVFLFDDIHLTAGDLMYSRLAAEKHLAADFPASERFAVYTTSGRVSADFTRDREKVVAAMRAIKPASLGGASNCPAMSYMADLIVNQNDKSALQAATSEAVVCAGLNQQQQTLAASMALTSAHHTAAIGDAETRLTLANLRSVIRVLAAHPGHRSLILISPGFFEAESYTDIGELIDLAIRTRVTVNTLDARGLNLIGVLPDISERSFDVQSDIKRMASDRQNALRGTMLLQEIAEGTGGVAFDNNNDLTSGFQKLTTAPEYTYILGFSPQNLKLDGSLHTLKVKLKDSYHLTTQARRGYYAPKHLADPIEEARRDIREALFSREVMHELPVELHTQYFKSGEFDAKLGVLARVDLAQLRFRKADGRNLDNLTIVAGLFDGNGNFLKGESKVIELKLKDETLQDKARSLVTFKTNFDVKIGEYAVRLVVRDSEGRSMASQNGSIVIP